MISLSIIRDSVKKDAAFQSRLAKSFSLEFKGLDELTASAPGQYSLVDFDFDRISSIPALKEWLRGKPDGAKVIFVTDKGSHLQTTRAFAIGATGIVHHPIEPQALLDKFLSANAPPPDKNLG